MSHAPERRWIAAEFEVRAKPTGGVAIEGYASVFNSLSQNLGGFVEQIAPGSFRKTIQEADVRALLNHDPNMVLGRNVAGTLRLAEDTRGLHYQVDLPDTSYARDLAVSMGRGDITQSSFGFRAIKDEWGFTEQDVPLRTVQEAQLFDVSPVTYPAYLDASSGVSQRSYALLAKKLGMDAETVAAADLRSLLKGEHRGGDDDPGKVAQAVDACIDEALDLFEAGETEQAIALVQAADLSIDQLLVLLGVPDPADPDDQGRSAATKDAIYAAFRSAQHIKNSKSPEPAAATPSDSVRRLRVALLGKRNSPVVSR